MKTKRGQVWIETVLYTLIAFVMIGLVLAYAKPKIEEIQDKAIIEQSIKILEDINNVILSIERVQGNQRVVDLEIKKGTLRVDGVNDLLSFEIESSYLYTEPDKDIYVGDIIAHTTEIGDINRVTLISNYSGIYNIKYRDNDELKIINRATTPYSMIISNKGSDGENPMIDFNI